MADKRNPVYNMLNNPLLFLLIRGVLDGGQLSYLKNLLVEYHVTSVLDIACGCGIASRIVEGEYLGIDYNPSFISFCTKRFGNNSKQFKVMDASRLRLDRQFDTAIIINSIHHFSDSEVESILSNMRDTTERLVIIHDAVPRRNPVSRLLYKLDRGNYFRTVEQQKRLASRAGIRVEEIRYFKTFPGVYLHSTLVGSVD
jgi:SAM-dependent methyltransferase